MKETFITLHPGQMIDLALYTRDRIKALDKVGKAKDCEFLKGKKQVFITSYTKN